MKKLISLALAAVMALSLVACGSGNKGKDTGDKTYKVGVVQLVQHEALDAATKGFTDALKEALGDKVEVVEKNASGDSNNCTTIVNGFISDKVDLIMANATPALQAAASATSTIPILGTSVTDYATALEIADWTWAATSPAPPTWLPWTSRPPCSRSCSPTPRRWVCSSAPASPTANTRLMR